MIELPKPVKYFLVGLAIDVGAIALLCAVMFIDAWWRYDGKCTDWFGFTPRPCPFREYYQANFFLLLLFIIYFGLWLLLLLPPFIGLIIGYVRARREEERS